MSKKSDWKKILLISILATITPGGFIVLGAIGIKKLLKKKEDKQ